MRTGSQGKKKLRRKEKSSPTPRKLQLGKLYGYFLNEKSPTPKKSKQAQASVPAPILICDKLLAEERDFTNLIHPFFSIWKGSDKPNKHWFQRNVSSPALLQFMSLRRISVGSLQQSMHVQRNKDSKFWRSQESQMESYSYSRQDMNVAIASGMNQEFDEVLELIHVPDEDNCCRATERSWILVCKDSEIACQRGPLKH